MYAEDDSGPPTGIAPVFASILKARLDDREALVQEARSLVEAIATGIGRSPENVHIIYEAAGLGRIALGGWLRLTERASARVNLRQFNSAVL